jgi:prepilin-type N-terminal cleavage/methylation domain-containing protein
MDNSSISKKGFTLVEVLISTAIVAVFLPFAANMLLNSQLTASYSKHKIQAAYAAKQIIETQRQLAAHNGTISSQGSTSVILDTKGNYDSNKNYFYGTSVITVTPAVYTSSSGVKTTSPNVDHVVVQISWKEQIANKKVTMTDSYAADIIFNDTMLS